MIGLEGTNVFFGMVFCAVVLEGIVTYIQTIAIEKNFPWQVITTISIGIVTAIAFNIDLFAIVGISSTIPFFGCILTGILLSRGSNYIFDIINRIQTGGDGKHVELKVTPVVDRHDD